MTVALQMSGWLPGDDRNGLSLRDGDLIDRFEARYAGQPGPEPTEVVIGVVRARAVKHRDGDNPAVVEVRFDDVEVVTGAEADQVLSMLHRVRDHRTNTPPLPGLEDPHNNVGGPSSPTGSVQLPTRDPFHPTAEIPQRPADASDDLPPLDNVVDPGDLAKRRATRKRTPKDPGS